MFGLGYIQRTNDTGGRKSRRSMVRALENEGQTIVAKPKLAANNTLDYTNASGQRTIRLHSTDILIFTEGGTGFAIDTGGWDTVTTRARLNQFLPAPWRVGHEKGELYLRRYDTQEKYQFDRSIEVDGAGNVVR